MEILLAVIAPPAAVWLCRESLGRSLSRSMLLATLLWGLGLLPGIFYALWIVVHHSPSRPAHRQPQLGRPNPFGTQ
jgi:uncharacterized membrane protein YqaE (UPF0057 family)